MQKNKSKPDGVYKTPLTHCPLCGSSRLSQHYTITKYKPAFKTDKCSDCGFIFMNPQFTDKIISDFYCENYYKGNAEYSYYDERAAEQYAMHVWKKRVKKIKSYISGGNFLDIGCAFGGLLKAASPYYTPYGIELSRYSADHAKQKFGSTIHNGSLKDHPFADSFFSVITMIEVIEHIDDPAGAISECYRLLKPGGLLLIQTANMGGMQAKLQKENYAYFMPGHLSYFSKKNLSDILLKTGFRCVKVFHPVDFGLLPKLLKSRYNFKSYRDYKAWLRIAFYHFLSKIRFGNFCATSSMVIYAFKNKD